VCRDRVVGVDRAETSEVRVTLGPRILAPFQTGPVSHSAFYEMGNTSPSPGIKQPGRGLNHPNPSSTGDEKRVQLYLKPPPLCAFMTYCRVKIIFFN
jgi:hypothetical protein